MKRVSVVGTVVATLAAGALSASAAPAKVKPVALTYFLHGTQPYGELENPPVAGSGYAPMDAKAPSGTAARSSGVTNYVGGPNTQCAGNGLFPVWVGAVDGAPTGDAKVDLFLQSAGSGSINVQLFADVDAQACNADYPVPLAEQTVAVANGQVSVTLKNVNRKGKPIRSLMLQVAPVLGPPYLARVQYDSTTAASKISFSCLPKAGKKTC